MFEICAIIVRFIFVPHFKWVHQPQPHLQELELKKTSCAKNGPRQCERSQCANVTMWEEQSKDKVELFELEKFSRKTFLHFFILHSVCLYFWLTILQFFTTSVSFPAICLPCHLMLWQMPQLSRWIIHKYLHSLVMFSQGSTPKPPKIPITWKSKFRFHTFWVFLIVEKLFRETVVELAEAMISRIHCIQNTGWLV